MNVTLYFVTVLIWGTTWIAINYQYGEVAVEWSIAYRFAIASALLFVFCFITGRNLLFPLKVHSRFIAQALCIFGFNYYLLYSGQQYLNSALNSILFSTMVMMNILHSRLFFGTPITSNTIIGAVLGTFGIGVLFWPTLSQTHWGDNSAIAIITCLCGTMIASWGNMLSISNQLRGIPILQTNAWGMGYGAIAMAIVATIHGNPMVFNTSFEYVASLLYLAIFGSVIAFGAYFALLTRIGTAKASYASILFPAIAVIISTLVENFIWSIFTIGGFVLIMLGNIIIITNPKWFKQLAADH
jgi:drug/metabolite transporter (DMT)-like permease